MSRHEGDVAFACAGLLVDELARAGIADACVAPGSRSTPLALALARHPRLRLHVHLDERSAGFFALGLAKASRRPAAVLCTSGTAAANLLPAVVEAAHARVPLVVLTADRPPELRGTSANQTIDQLKLFGDYPRLFVETGVPDTHEGAARYWRSLGARAAAAAWGSPAGPVHLNIPFREPLVPTGSVVDLGLEAAGRPGDAPWERVVVAQARPDPYQVGELAAILGGVERGVIVAGALDGDAPSVLDLAAHARWPLLAEATSGLRRPPHALPAAQHLLSDDVFAAEHRPDVVLQIGAPPIGRAGQAFVASGGILVRVDPDGPFPDPSRAASWTVRADPDDVARLLLQRLRPQGGSAWLDSWREADRHARDAVDGLLDSWETPFEGRLARDLALALPGGSTLVVSSSMPVRDLDTFAAPREGVRVLANRGANGIDGFVSTVLGVAASGAPTYALAGDL
ncbi:MAG: 2-succinyl-5-enolpyruvyl-6-hydroxy-3-cyclohexene-1-carboxylic-acid synthase, partial [Chloroflexi bacterium]|nr:2-succinyl-5-enolpyruvyl-6-hydroxy-3-cyclohexene-1-carboxylic-acid synthase [Chloroflexota bacterium]